MSETEILDLTAAAGITKLQTYDEDVEREEVANVEKASNAKSKVPLPQDEPHIIFIDPIGTRWSLPYEKAKTWDGAKTLLKTIFTETYMPHWASEDIDGDKEGFGASFSIIGIKPESLNIHSSHWELLVRPGWEFKIKFSVSMDSLIYRIRRNKESADKPDDEESSSEGSSSEDSLAAESPAAEDPSSVVYLARYLVRNRAGDYRQIKAERRGEKTTVLAVPGLKFPGPKSVLEEHREVYSSDKGATHIADDMFDTIGDPVLYIHSPILLNALKAIIDFQSIPDLLCPKEDSADIIKSNLGRGRFVYPFTDLHHYRESLIQYKQEVQKAHDDEYSTICRDHIDILIGYLAGLPEVGWADAEALCSQTVPKITFGSLWLLLKAGSCVYVREEGITNAYVIESFQGGIPKRSQTARSVPYVVCVWNLNFDGQFLTRSTKEVSIPVFDYEREILSLPLYPIQFHKDVDAQKPLHQQLLDRGRKFVEVVKSPSFQEYNGPSKLQGTRKYTNARVVIDHTSQPWKLDKFKKEPNARVPIETVQDVDLGERTRKAKCPCETCEADSANKNNVQRRAFDDYDKINLNSPGVLTDQQYVLCWSHVYGYVLNDRAWDILEVSGLRQPKIQKDIIDTLVLKPERNKTLIKAVCEIFGGTNTKGFSSDFIHGKGEGQILLLHGPPGTGKTLTAESVAEYTGRPLLSITAADLGHEPELLERNLLEFFRNAQKWNAIVLLDEADVYLETRSTQDLRRNGIVSVFLRALDYFQGILFLTTNRVGSFDEAFISRIHVQIGYEPLNDESREKIWHGFIKKLAQSREDGGQEIRCSWNTKEYIAHSEELRALKWNGREIRNAFQTAVALACFEAKGDDDRIPELQDDHIREVVNMSRKFKDYLKGLHGDEIEVAYQTGIRNDGFVHSVGN
ncbi:ATPase AAA-type core [Penicillium frequentans]|uniref:ATPase AAA-type core n=1 Tax=Penicillium frequentans TaxID=3151616 RepID=A0AAD6GJ08_9EURO|nr:ATPase AAA-type core [Penicillium glabrum]